MSYKIGFDPTSDKWALSDGEHYLEVPHWAREIIADEFERETEPLKAENAKLRDDRDGWKKVCVDQEVMHVMHEDALDNEIAKLRELVKDMWPHVRHRSRMCGECKLSCDTSDECLLYEPMRRRMAELGVEVDG